MTCAQADAYFLRSPSEAVPKELEQHLHECSRCRLLLGVLAESEPWPEIAPATLRRLESKILDGLTPVRPLPPERLFLLAFVAVFAVLVALGAHRLGPYNWESLSIAQKAGIFLPIAASAALLGFSLVRQMVPGSRHHISPPLLPIGVFVLLLLTMAGTLEYVREPGFVGPGVACLRAGIPYSIPAALAFWLLLRRGAMFSPLATGAATGALAGLVGVTVLELHCPNSDVLHVITFHLGVLLIGATAGLGFGAMGRLLARRQDQAGHGIAQ